MHGVFFDDGLPSVELGVSPTGEPLPEGGYDTHPCMHAPFVMDREKAREAYLAIKNHRSFTVTTTDPLNGDFIKLTPIGGSR